MKSTRNQAHDKYLMLVNMDAQLEHIRDEFRLHFLSIPDFDSLKNIDIKIAEAQNAILKTTLEYMRLSYAIKERDIPQDNQ